MMRMAAAVALCVAALPAAAEETELDYAKAKAEMDGIKSVHAYALDYALTLNLDPVLANYCYITLLERRQIYAGTIEGSHNPMAALIPRFGETVDIDLKSVQSVQTHRVAFAKAHIQLCLANAKNAITQAESK
jgi:hypothetical protein